MKITRFKTELFITMGVSFLTALGVFTYTQPQVATSALHNDIVDHSREMGPRNNDRPLTGIPPTADATAPPQTSPESAGQPLSSQAAPTSSLPPESPQTAPTQAIPPGSSTTRVSPVQPSPVQPASNPCPSDPNAITNSGVATPDSDCTATAH
jgi:hypothetical protein